MDTSYASLIVSGVSAIISAVSLLARGDSIESLRERKLCKHLTALRRHLIAVVETGEEIGIALENDTFTELEEVQFLRTLLWQQICNVELTVNSFQRVRSVLDYEGIGGLQELLSEKDEVLRIFHANVTLSEDELNRRFERIAAKGDIKVVRRDDVSFLKLSRATAFPDGNFDKIRDCVPKLSECISKICKPVNLWS